MVADRRDLRGVAGWLGWLVFAMCVIGPLISLGSSSGDIAQAERANPFLTTIPGWSDYKRLTTAIQTAAAVCLFIGGILLWKRHKRSSVYIAIASLWVANLGAVLAHHVSLVQTLPQFADDATFNQTGLAVFKAILIAGVWTLYLLLSRRVKNTYSTATTTDATPIHTSTAARTEPSFQAANLSADRLTEIERLKALLDSGALTQDEFDIEKRRVLNQ